MSQAVYFPIRTLYLTLKIEQRERFKTGQELQQLQQQQQQQQQQRGSSESPGTDQQPQQQQQQQQHQTAETGAIRATRPMWRCSRIMHTQRDLHPTVLSSLEGKSKVL